MQINLSETASNAMLEALSVLMDGGSIELQTGDGTTLAVLQLASPAAMPAVDSALDFNDIAMEDAALAQGTALQAVIVGIDGREVFVCDVGDKNSDAVIKLTSTKIDRGVPVRLESFRLVMP